MLKLRTYVYAHAYAVGDVEGFIVGRSIWPDGSEIYDIRVSESLIIKTVERTRIVPFDVQPVQAPVIIHGFVKEWADAA